MNTDSLQRRGIRRAFLALLWLSAGSAMGCTKCSPSGIFTRDAGTSTPDAAPNACAVLPNPPPAQPNVPEPCRYWVVDTAIAKTTCQDVSVPAKPGKSWRATKTFGNELVPETLSKYCNYQWSDSTTNPTDADIALLPAPPARSSNCTYITPQQTTPDIFTQWAHNELLPPMAQRLPASGNAATVDIKVRVVVLDTAPSIVTTATNSRSNQHGRTLTQLIRASSCQNSASNPADCAVEVRSALAMPRIMNTQTGTPELRADGGDFGLLSDLANAVWLETVRYRSELESQDQVPGIRRTTPTRVIFNESFGFGNTDALPNRCGDTPPANDVTTAALFDAMMTASCLGILHVAAAGNHTGGASHLDGMLCPARWDHAIVPTDAACGILWGKDTWEGSKGLKARFKEFSTAKTREQRDFALISPSDTPDGADSLLSVGGVDYHGLPIVLSRPKACPEAVAIGIGGNGLENAQNILPFLFGTSVSAAVASSRIAVQWAQNPMPTASAIQRSNGSSPTPFLRNAGLCGGATIACPKEIPWIGRPATPIVGQNNAWPLAPVNLWTPVAPLTTSSMDPVVCLDKVPHCVRPSKAITADVWPQPAMPACLRCGIYLPKDTDSRPQLWIEPNPDFTPGTTDPILVVEDQDGVVVLTLPVSTASLATSSRTVLAQVNRAIFSNARVWLSGYDSAGQSYSQQIFVDQ